MVTKGRFSLPDTGEVYQFMLNPEVIKDKHKVTYSDQQVPGISHPTTQYAAGGARIVSFSLYLDGDLGRRYSKASNSLRTGKGDSIDVADDIAFLRSLQFPIRRDSQVFTDVRPPIVIFSYGVLYEGMQCVVKINDIDHKKLTQDLRPIRSVVSLELQEIVSQGMERSQIFRK